MAAGFKAQKDPSCVVMWQGQETRAEAGFTLMRMKFYLSLCENKREIS